MSHQSSSAPAAGLSGEGNQFLFWACFVSLIATAFGFVTRFSLLNEWGQQFNLNEVQLGEIGGVGVWPFAISIILFSLVVDKIGYGTAMAFAFFAHVSYGIIVICAPLMLAGPGASPEQVIAGQKAAYWMLYIGSLIFALGNGTVEAVINPVVATMFSREKTKWLNILHAGWPGGLVLAGLMTIAMGTIDWRYKIALIFLPAVAYGIMMAMCKFPVNERVAAGGTYKGMLQEFGVLAAIVVFGLIVRQIGDVFKLDPLVQFGAAAALVVAFGLYVQSLGRAMLFFLMLIMIPLATTEIGTDGWITSLMEPEMTKMGLNAAWVLVYTSFIMMVLRFFAGPIVHNLSPLGLLATSAVIAAIGLTYLSTAAGSTILIAATLYGFGKTFFWPTMLGVVSEQCPKGGALTLNAIGGVGMLGVGVLGFPFIGLLQVNAVADGMQKQAPAIFEQVKEEQSGMFGKYVAVSPEKAKTLPESEQAAIVPIEEKAKKGALGTMAIFPCIMLAAYLILIVYFKSRGGYKAEVLTGHAAEDAKFTGGVPAAVE
jgi:MFS family permease